MMSDEMLKKMPHAMLQGANEMMKKPLASGAMMAGAGFAAGRGLLGKTVLGGALLRHGELPPSLSADEETRYREMLRSLDPVSRRKM